MIARTLSYTLRGLVLVSLLSSCGLSEKESNKGHSASPKNPDTALLSAIDNAIEKEMRENHIPGVALVLVRDGQTLYKKGYGVENTETDVSVEPDRTIFRIGSTSKALTFLTLTRLVDQGRISRSDDVTTFFPEIENTLNFDSPVTIDHLLTHTAGFDQPGYGRQIGGFDYPLAERQAARPNLSEFLGNRNLRRINPAGEYFRYDTYGATLAGLIIERVTGLPYPKAMKKEMFAPLGMTRTSVEVEPEHAKDLAKGHGYVDEQYVQTSYEVYVTPPASSIDATATDMGRLLEALTGQGANEHGRLFSSSAAQAVLDPQYRPHPDFAGITHGLWESFGIGRGADAIPVRTLGHGGDMWGFNGTMEIIPEYNLGFYVVANRNSEGGGSVVKIGRPVMRAIMAVLAPGRVASPIELPKLDTTKYLNAYQGNYYWGAYCHSCEADEFDLGAWRKPNARSVTASNGALIINNARYLPLKSDIFVKEDGYEQVFFNRNSKGEITSFSHREDPTVYERERGL